MPALPFINSTQQSLAVIDADIVYVYSVALDIARTFECAVPFLARK